MQPANITAVTTVIVPVFITSLRRMANPTRRTIMPMANKSQPSGLFAILLLSPTRPFQMER